MDQAPFAIEDLLKEVKATGEGAEESDSGQASEEEEEVEKEPPKGKKTAKEPPKKTTGGQTNGRRWNIRAIIYGLALAWIPQVCCIIWNYLINDTKPIFANVQI